MTTSVHTTDSYHFFKNRTSFKKSGVLIQVRHIFYSFYTSAPRYPFYCYFTNAPHYLFYSFYTSEPRYPFYSFLNTCFHQTAISRQTRCIVAISIPLTSLAPTHRGKFQRMANFFPIFFHSSTVFGTCNVQNRFIMI